MTQNTDLDIENERPEVDEATTIDLLKKGAVSQLLPAKAYYGLSQLDNKKSAAIRETWNSLSSDYRRKILSQLNEFSETDFYVDYREIGYWGLGDQNPDVQVAAIELLWEDESLTLMHSLMDLVTDKHTQIVRIAALKALGRFLLLGEYGDIPEEVAIKAQQIVIDILQNEVDDYEINRRALEAIAHTSHAIVKSAIRNAYNHGNHDMRVSAIFAMGKSCDNVWEEIILDELDNSDAEIRYEAARSSGELELDSAVGKLGRLLMDDDREITEVSIWALGEIGGREAIRILDAMAAVAEEQKDEELLNSIDEALDSANFSSGLGLFSDIDVTEL